MPKEEETIELKSPALEEKGSEEEEEQKEEEKGKEEEEEEEEPEPEPEVELQSSEENSKKKIEYKYNSIINIFTEKDQKYKNLLESRRHGELLLMDDVNVGQQDQRNIIKSKFEDDINFIGEFKKFPEKLELLDLWKLHVDCYEQFIRINPDYVSRNSRNFLLSVSRFLTGS